MGFSYRVDAVPSLSDVELLNLTVISLRCILFEKGLYILESLDHTFMGHNATSNVPMTTSFFISELVEKLTLVCPNLEILRVDNTEIKRWIGINKGDFLNFIRFQKLKSLHLYGPFQLNDGAFLLQVSIFHKIFII